MMDWKKRNNDYRKQTDRSYINETTEKIICVDLCGYFLYRKQKNAKKQKNQILLQKKQNNNKKPFIEQVEV